MHKIILISGLLFLSSCSYDVSKSLCPSIVNYTKAQETSLYTDIENGKISDNGIEWLEDYINLRDQVRACNGISTKN